MRQVLFNIPLNYFDWMPSWLPKEIPIYGFGLMLFLTFITCTLWAGWRARKEGINPQYLQDLAVWIFIGGIIGARIVYMLQYGVPLSQFFEIWKGGLVFYGSAVGGVLGYAAAWFFIIRMHGLSTRQLADIIAPAVAWGLMLGRVGCLLNGCCYGHVAGASCPAVPFPLGAPPRYTLVQDGLQTAAGFTVEEPGADPRSRIARVEDASPAAESGLRTGDTVLKVNGENNQRIIEVKGSADAISKLANELNQKPTILREDDSNGSAQFAFDGLEEYRTGMDAIKKSDQPVFVQARYDTLWDVLVHHWPRGQYDLALTVQHTNGQEQALSFAPWTIGLHPTQLYESISMFLLFLLLNAFFPFRRHYGEVFVLLMFGYAIHRFVNEMLRNDTAPVFQGMTLSQNGSILFGLLAVGLLIWLWRRPIDKGLEPAPAEGPQVTADEAAALS